jgi:hypothetical protein
MTRFCTFSKVEYKTSYISVKSGMAVLPSWVDLVFMCVTYDVYTQLI